MLVLEIYEEKCVWLLCLCCYFFLEICVYLVGNIRTLVWASLVPRLPHSGTWTLKLCRRGEPGIFSHVKSAKDRHKVDATLIVRGHMSLRTGKRAKIAGNLLHVSSYRASNIIHTECWSIVGWTTRKTLPLFCFSPILIMSCLRRRDSSSPCDTYSHFRRAWELVV